ncbi:hypothetical protein [Nocardioides aquaticus]|nr:hypothetical protein [Nocardioides aquaticus]
MPPKTHYLYAVGVDYPDRNLTDHKVNRLWTKLSTAINEKHDRARRGPHPVHAYRAELVWVEIDDDGNPVEHPEAPARRDDRGLLGDALGSLD